MHSKRKWLPSWQRIELVELALAAPGGGLAPRQRLTVQHWVDRHLQATEAERASGEWAHDRPSTPHRQSALSSPAVHDRVCEAGQRTGWGPRLIASELDMAHATVSRC